MALPRSETSSSSASENSNQSVIDNSELPDWLKVDVLRVDVNIEHITPFERKFTKEIIYQNSGKSNIIDIIIPSPEFFHGLRIIDEDNSLLTFYSIQEIQNKIANYTRDIKEGIENQLQQAYLLWIRLPDHKSIKPEEIRTIRLEYLDANDSNIGKFSMFDIPQFFETIYNMQSNIETYYFIKTSNDFVIEIDRTATNAYTLAELEKDGDPKKIEINYLAERRQDDFKDNCIDIKNTSNYITARIPNAAKPYVIRLYYKIKLAPVERNIWRVVLPSVGFLLTFVLVSAFFPGNPYFSLNQTSLVAIGASVMSVAGALIALISNPLIRRTRGLLFIHVGISIAILVIGGISKCTQTC